MDLIERIKKIAKIEGIPESQLILDEADFFLREHLGHGTTQIRLEYDLKLEYIGLYCTAIDLVDVLACSHHNPAQLGGGDSIIYCPHPLIHSEIKRQQERREFVKAHHFLNH